MGQESELSLLINEIKSNTKQIAINRIDEVRVMRCMLNDPNFKLAVYDKNMGYIGEKCPREEAVNFVKNIVAGTTGLDTRESKHLAENYEFTKKDSQFLVDNAKDFIQVYTKTGRKMNIIQNEFTEANIYTRNKPVGNKSIPDKDNPSKTKIINIPAYTKLVSESKCPKYSM